MAPRRSILAVTLSSAACAPLPEADQSLGDALVTTLRSLPGEDDALAAALRNVERGIYANLQVAADDVVLRSAEAQPIAVSDVAALVPRPDVDPSGSTSVFASVLSAHPLPAHVEVALVEDWAAAKLEPTSLDNYTRVFLEGRDCFADRGCAVLRTTQEVTKSVVLASVTYTMRKDYRWIDLSLGTDEDPRWAMAAVSWNDDTYRSEDGLNELTQSYTADLWFPLDGRGFRWDAEPGGPPEGAYADSASPGGVMRVNALWAQSRWAIPLDEATENGTIRWGIQRNFEAQEAWLDARDD